MNSALRVVRRATLVLDDPGDAYALVCECVCMNIIHIPTCVCVCVCVCDIPAAFLMQTESFAGLGAFDILAAQPKNEKLYSVRRCGTAGNAGVCV